MLGVDFSTQPDDTQTPRLPNGDFDHGAAGNTAREREREVLRLPEGDFDHGAASTRIIFSLKYIVRLSHSKLSSSVFFFFSREISLLFISVPILWSLIFVHFHTHIQ